MSLAWRVGDEPDGLGGAKPLSSLFPKCLSFFFTHEWMSGGIIGLACSSTSAHLSPETGSFPGRSFMPRVPPEPAAESQRGQPAKGAPSGDSRAVWVCVCNGRLTDRPSICLVRGAQKKGYFSILIQNVCFLTFKELPLMGCTASGNSI